MPELTLRGVFFVALSSVYLNNGALCQQTQCDPVKGGALLGKQGICSHKRSKRTFSVTAENPFLLAGVAPQTL